MRNPTHVRLSTKRRIALLLFVTMLSMVLQVFPSSLTVSAEPIADIVTENMDQPIVEEAAAVSGGIIPDGIYRLSNRYLKDNYSYGNFYLRAENGTVELSSNTYGDHLDNLYSYWHFEHRGNNEYMIRNMADFDMALSMSNGDAILSPVAGAFRWILQADSYGGYQLRSAYTPTNDLLSATTTPTGHQHPNNTSYYYYTTDVYVGPIADMTIDSWELSTVNVNGLYFQKTSNGKLYDTFNKTYDANSSVSLSSMGYTVKAISPTNGLVTPSSITWTSSNSTVATVAASGNVTLLSCGETTITASAYVNGVQKTASYTLVAYLDAALIALPRTEDGSDRSSYFSSIAQDLSSIGYTNSYNNHSVVANGVTEADMLRFMQYSKITLIRTHGLPTSIELTDGSLERHELLALPFGALDYSDLIIYGACLTASGGEYANNMLSATVDAGARTVIGFENNVNVFACNEWCRVFFEKLESSYYNSAKNYDTVCEETDNVLKNHPWYSYIAQGELVTVENYMIAGANSFP